MVFRVFFVVFVLSFDRRVIFLEVGWIGWEVVGFSYKTRFGDGVEVVYGVGLVGGERSLYGVGGV